MTEAVKKPKYDNTEFLRLIYRKFGDAHGCKANAAKTLQISGPYLYHIISGIHPVPKKHMRRLKNLPDYEDNFGYASDKYFSFLQVGLDEMASTQWNIVRENYKKKGVSLDATAFAIFRAGLESALNQIDAEVKDERIALQMKRDLEDDNIDPLAD